eukprot:scaffold3141_cov53-Attheya_sp.AAC.7
MPIILLSMLSWNDGRSIMLGVANAAAMGSKEMRGYSRIKAPTELFKFISNRQWTAAHQRLDSDPDEAWILVKPARDKEEHKTALHQVFAIDVTSDSTASSVDNDSTTTTLAQMPEEQVRLIHRLLDMNPMAVIVEDGPLTKYLPLHLACYSSLPPPAAVIQRMLESEEDTIEASDKGGRLPLHAAAHFPTSSLEIHKLLLDAYSEAAFVKDSSGMLPIHLASWGGSSLQTSENSTWPVVELLLQIHPKSYFIPDRNGDVPLTTMVKYGRTSLDVLAHMLDQHDQNTILALRDKHYGNTALHSALTLAGDVTANSAPSMVDLLLERFPEYASVQNNNGQLPLHAGLVSCCINPDIINQLLEAYPEGATIQDKTMGRLPLHYACQAGVSHPRIVMMLMESYPEGVQVQDKDRGLPLHLAIRASLSKKNEAIMQGISLQLLEAYPEATRVVEKVKSTQNRNMVETNLPLHIALRQMSSSGFELVQALLNAFPDATKTTVHQYIGGTMPTTALHMVSRLAHSYESEAHVRALVLDDEDQLPLHHACHSGDEMAIAVMLKHFPEGAGQSTKNGKLPLHLVFEGVVAENGNDAIVQALLKAYPEAAASSTQRGDYPLHLAASSSNHLRYSNDTLEALIDAYPAALNTTNNNKALPLHLSIRMLSDRSGNGQSSHMARTLLSHYPEAARVKRIESYPLEDALGFAARSPLLGQEPDIALEIVQLLYDAYPHAALASDLQGRTPLHITMQIIGRMGGHLTLKWAALTLNIISTYPDTLSARTKPVGDNEGDTPFHILCDVLAQSVDIYKRDSVLETLVYKILSTYPGAIEDKDDYGLNPLEIIETETLANNASKDTIVSFLKTWLKRGVSYWELEGELERIREELLQAKDLNVCEKLQSEIDALKSTIKHALEDNGSTLHDEKDETPSNTQQHCELEVEDSDSNQDACGICHQQVGIARLLSKQIEHLASVLDSQITS